jgi:hypothetical protein
VKNLRIALLGNSIALWIDGKLTWSEFSLLIADLDIDETLGPISFVDKQNPNYRSWAKRIVENGNASTDIKVWYCLRVILLSYLANIYPAYWITSTGKYNLVDSSIELILFLSDLS